LSCRPCLPCRRRKCRTAGPLRSTGITPLPRYYGPIRHPLVVDRFPGIAGYTSDLTPLISQRDEEGFSSCSRRLDHRAVAPSPAGALRRVSQTATARMAFAESSTARPPGLGSFEANSRSLTLRPGDSLTTLAMALSIGFRVLVSLHPAIQATERLALAPTGLAPVRRTCLLWTRDDVICPEQQRRRHRQTEGLGVSFAKTPSDAK
jgi:hypothetical protein